MALHPVIVGTSAQNTAQTVSTPATTTSTARRLLYVAVAYSAAPTQTGVVVTLNSAAGAGYDTALSTGTANARYTVYIPDEPLVIAIGDAIDVLCPAAGGTITSSASIYTETYV